MEGSASTAVRMPPVVNTNTPPSLWVRERSRILLNLQKGCRPAPAKWDRRWWLPGRPVAAAVCNSLRQVRLSDLDADAPVPWPRLELGSVRARCGYRPGGSSVQERPRFDRLVRSIGGGPRFHAGAAGSTRSPIESRGEKAGLGRVAPCLDSTQRAPSPDDAWPGALIDRALFQPWPGSWLELAERNLAEQILEGLTFGSPLCLRRASHFRVSV